MRKNPSSCDDTEITLNVLFPDDGVFYLVATDGLHFDIGLLSCENPVQLKEHGRQATAKEKEKNVKRSTSNSHSRAAIFI